MKSEAKVLRANAQKEEFGRRVEKRMKEEGRVKKESTNEITRLRLERGRVLE